MKAKEVDHKLDLHVKDYVEVRKDVDVISGGIAWVLKIVVGSILVTALVYLGLSK